MSPACREVAKQIALVMGTFLVPTLGISTIAMADSVKVKLLERKLEDLKVSWKRCQYKLRQAQRKHWYLSSQRSWKEMVEGIDQIRVPHDHNSLSCSKNGDVGQASQKHKNSP